MISSVQLETKEVPGDYVCTGYATQASPNEQRLGDTDHPEPLHGPVVGSFAKAVGSGGGRMYGVESPGGDQFVEEAGPVRF